MADELKMDVREKLAEIVKKAAYSSLPSNTEDFHLNMFVTNLLSHGVTVQEWISVDDRLPEYPGHYLVCTSINYWHGGCMDINENHKYHPNGTPVGYDGSTMSVLDCYYDVTGHWNLACDSHVTHWMPIPEPPKGE